MSRVHFLNFLKVLACAFAGLLSVVNAFAGNDGVEAFSSQRLGFEQNMGQVLDAKRNRCDNVYFKAVMGDATAFFTNEGVTFVFAHKELSEFEQIMSGMKENPYSPEEWERIRNKVENENYYGDITTPKLQVSALKMMFPGADLTNAIGEDKKLEERNYFTPEYSDGLFGVPVYDKIRYKNVYPGTDLVFYFKDSKLEYDLELSANADLSLIGVMHDYHKKMSVDENGNVIVEMDKAVLVEHAPKCYQDGQELRARYYLDNGIVKFDVDGYDSTKPLTIDPVLTWSTYYYDGSATTNINSYVTRPVWDSNGNMFVVSSSSSSTFPTVNPGGSAYYEANDGGLWNYDNQIQIVKFNTSKEVVWATYYCNTQDAYLNTGNQSAVIDGQDNLYVVGHVFYAYSSEHRFPLYNPGNGAYYETELLNNRNFILEFNASTGQRLWATMYCTIGEFSSGLTISGLSVDSNNNLVIDGYLYTPDNSWESMPVANPGGSHYYRPGTSAVEEETAFLSRFNGTNHALNWGTYISQGASEAYVTSTTRIAIDGKNNIYVTSGYSKTNAAFTTVNPGSGAYVTSTNGAHRQVALYKFSPAGAMVWATLFGGTSFSGSTIAWTDCFDAAIDGNENLVIVGRTPLSDFPTRNPGSGAYFQSSLSSAGMCDGFIAKFNSSCNLVWSSYLGGATTTSDGNPLQSLAIDGYNNVYVSALARTSSYPLMQMTGSYYQATATGNTNVTMSMFDTNGAMKWSTYFGNNVQTGLGGFNCGNSCGEKLVRIGYTPSPYPTINTSGYEYYNDDPEGTSTDFIAEFTIGDGVLGSVDLGDIEDEYCKNATPDALPTTVNGVAGTWSPSSIATDEVVENAEYIFTPTNTCYVKDTLFVTVTECTPCTVTMSPLTTACGGQAFDLTATVAGVTSGTLTWYDGDSPLGTSTITAAGNYTFEVPAASATTGQHNFSVAITEGCNTVYQVGDEVRIDCATGNIVTTGGDLCHVIAINANTMTLISTEVAASGFANLSGNNGVNTTGMSGADATAALLAGNPGATSAVAVVNTQHSGCYYIPSIEEMRNFVDFAGTDALISSLPANGRYLTSTQSATNSVWGYIYNGTTLTENEATSGGKGAFLAKDIDVPDENEDVVASQTVTVSQPLTLSYSSITATQGMAITTMQPTTNCNGTTVSYEATGLPTGLIINSSTGAISGVPSVHGTGTAEITITCDGCEATAEVPFTISSSNSSSCYETGTLLFKEDFGGNDVSANRCASLTDLAAMGMNTRTNYATAWEITECNTDRNYQWATGENGWDCCNHGPCLDDRGVYAIVKYTHHNHPGWAASLSDHTYPDDVTRGYMMQVEAGSTSGMFYQTTIDGLCSGAVLYFSTWILNVNTSQSISGLNFHMANASNNAEIADYTTPAISASSNPTWTRYGMTFVVPAGVTSVKLSLNNPNASTSGNDFAIDDIEIRLCVPEILLPVGSEETAKCEGDTYNINASFTNDGTFSTPLQYQWFYSQTGDPLDNTEWTAITSQTQEDLSITNVQESNEGYYRLAVASQGGVNTNCRSVSDPIHLTVNPTPTASVSISGDDEVCIGEDAVLAAGPTTGVTYRWSTNPAQTTQTINIHPTAQTTYTVTVTKGSCSDEASITVGTCDCEITASATQTAGYCNGTITLQAAGENGSGNYSYRWNTGTTTAQLTNATNNQTYTVTVTDTDTHCTASATITASQTGFPTIGANPTVPAITCNGGATSITLTVSGGFPQYHYTWQNHAEATTNVLSNIGAGTYNVTITDDHSCTAVKEISVSQPDPITMTTSTVDQICEVLGSAFVNNTTGGANTTYSYVWRNSLDQQIATGQSIEQQLMAGTYTVIATDVNNCTGSANAVVQGSGGSVYFDYSTENLKCYNDNTGEITLTNISGNQPFSVTWSHGAETETVNLGQNIDTYTIENLPAAEFVVTVVDHDGCSYTPNGFIELTQPAELAASASITTDINCNGDKFNITSSATGGTGTNYSYHWSNNVDEQSQTGLETYTTYVVTITDENLCTAIASVSPQEPSLVQVIVSADPILCFGGTTTITVSGVGGTETYTGTGVFENMPADTYNYTITDGNNCSASYNNFIVDQPLALSINVGTIVPQTCETPGSVPFTISGGTAGYNYSWDGGTAATYTAAVTSTLSSGSHTLSVTDANGCSATQEINVSNASAMTVSRASQTNIDCNGESTGAFTIEMTNGLSPYEITWTNGSLDETADSHSFTNLVAGTYNVTVSDANGCSDNISVTLTQTEPVLVTASLASGILCHNDAFGITASAEGGNGGFAYHWSNNVDEATQTGLTNYTTYYVTATDARGCFAVGSVAAVNPAAIRILGVDAGAISCAGGRTTITAYAEGGTGDLTYTWSTTGISAVPSQQITVPAGTYNLVVSDENGCTLAAASPVNVAEPDPITITLNSVTAQHCSTYGQANMTVNGGTGSYSYSWDGNTTQSATGNPIVSQLAAGSYVLTVSDANDCSATKEVTIENATPMSVVADNLQHQLCYGEDNGSFDVVMTNGTNPYTITWNEGIITEQNATHTFGNLVAGTYYVTVEDANHCSGQVTVEVTEPRRLDAISTVGQIACHDGTASVTIDGSNGTRPYHIEYNNETMEVGTYELHAGEYDCFVVDNNGCQAPVHISLINPPALTVNVVPSNALCHGGNGTAELHVDGGTRPYSIIWQDGATDMVNSHVPSDVEFGYTVTDANGCFVDSVVTVGQPDAMTLSLTPNNASCYGVNDGSVSVQSVSGGVLPYGFVWSNGQNGGSSINGLGAGNYTLVVTDANNCTVSATSSVMQPDELVATIVSTNVECGISEGSVTANVFGGTGDYSYIWSNGRVDVSMGNLTSGSYSLTATDANGCTATASTRISIAGMLTASISELTPISCFGQNDATLVAEVEMAQEPVTYVWNSGQSGQTQYGLGMGQYIVTATDAWGCVGVATYLVSSPSAVMLTAQTTDALCYNTFEGSIETHVYGGHPPYTYLWTNGSTDSNLDDLRQGTYGLVVTDSTGCVVQQNFTINAPERIEITPEITNIDCHGKKNGKVLINVQGGVLPYDYGFSIGNAMVHGSNYYEHLKPGSYEIMIGDANGCRESQTIVISEPAKLEGEAVITKPSCKDLNDGMIEMRVVGGSEPYVYTWSTYSQDSSAITGLRSGKYNITVVDANGCAVEFEDVTVPRSTADCIRIPNVFTPNGDGINDEWIIDNIEQFPEAHIYVFNRWGQLLYHGRGADEPWNGEFKDHFVPAGVYLYVIDLHTVEETYEGTVTILF